MRLTTPNLTARQAGMIVLALLLIIVLFQPGKMRAQRTQPPVAQVGPGSPLPVYLTNDVPPLPDGFNPGTQWKFTTWTIPSTLTFVATVQKTEGGWALLTLSTDTSNTSKWYYVPMMPGAWEPR